MSRRDRRALHQKTSLIIVTISSQSAMMEKFELWLRLIISREIYLFFMSALFKLISGNSRQNFSSLFPAAAERVKRKFNRKISSTTLKGSGFLSVAEILMTNRNKGYDFHCAERAWRQMRLDDAENSASHCTKGRNSVLPKKFVCSAKFSIKQERLLSLLIRRPIATDPQHLIHSWLIYCVVTERKWNLWGWQETFFLFLRRRGKVIDLSFQWKPVKLVAINLRCRKTVLRSEFFNLSRCC